MKWTNENELKSRDKALTKESLRVLVERHFSRQELYFILGLLDKDFDPLLDNDWLNYSKEIKRKLSNQARHQPIQDSGPEGLARVSYEETLRSVDQFAALPPATKSFRDHFSLRLNEEPMMSLNTLEQELNVVVGNLDADHQETDPNLPDPTRSMDIELPTKNDNKEDHAIEENKSDWITEREDDNFWSEERKDEWEDFEEAGIEGDDEDEDEEGKLPSPSRSSVTRNQNAQNIHQGTDRELLQNAAILASNPNIMMPRFPSKVLRTNEMFLSASVSKAIDKAYTLTGLLELNKIFEKEIPTANNVVAQSQMLISLTEKQLETLVTRVCSSVPASKVVNSLIDMEQDPSQLKLNRHNQRLLFAFVIFTMQNPATEKNLMNKLLHRIEEVWAELEQQQQIYSESNFRAQQASRILNYIEYYNQLMHKNIFTTTVLGTNYLSRLLGLLKYHKVLQNGSNMKRIFSIIKLAARNAAQLPNNLVIAEELSNLLLATLFTENISSKLSSQVMEILRKLYVRNREVSPDFNSLLTFLLSEGKKVLEDLKTLNFSQGEEQCINAKVDLMVEVYVLLLELSTNNDSAQNQNKEENSKRAKQLIQHILVLCCEEGEWTQLLDKICSAFTQENSSTIDILSTTNWLKKLVMLFAFHYIVVQGVYSQENKDPEADKGVFEMGKAASKSIKQTYAIEFFIDFAEKHQDLLRLVFSEETKHLNKNLVQNMYAHCPWLLTMEDKRALLE